MYKLKDFLMWFSFSLLCRKKKRAQIIYTGSLQQQKRPDVVIRRAHSSVGKGGVIDEDEILSSYTNIDVPNPEQPKNNETDSAFGSGFEEEEEEVRSCLDLCIFYH